MLSESIRSAFAVLEIAPVDLEAHVDAMSDEQRLDLACSLEGIIECAAQRLGYVKGRIGYSGGRGHADAVRQSNTLMTGVRKVMNFSYPAAANISF